MAYGSKVEERILIVPCDGDGDDDGIAVIWCMALSHPVLVTFEVIVGPSLEMAG